MYTVMYVGRDVPMAAYDGWAARLRLLSDGVPVQLFRAIAPMPALLKLQPWPGNDWWTEFVSLGGAAVEAAIEGGFKPHPDPAAISDVWPDVIEAHSRSTQPGPHRRHLPAVPPMAGIEVRRFGPGFVDRRTQPRS